MRVKINIFDFHVYPVNKVFYYMFEQATKVNNIKIRFSAK